jgi:N-acetylmuramoyl-L-alanine amidase
MELGYLSNPGDCGRLSRRSFREQTARAIYNALVEYFRDVDPAYPLKPVPLMGQYVVRKGDTLSEIAKAYNVSVSALMRVNHLKSDLIYPGRRLLIPR